MIMLGPPRKRLSPVVMHREMMLSHWPENWSGLTLTNHASWPESK